MSFPANGEAGRIQKIKVICDRKKIDIEEMIRKEYNYKEVTVSGLGGVWIVEEGKIGEMLSEVKLLVIADFLEGQSL